MQTDEKLLVARNIYSIVDKELERMHNLMRTYVTMRSNNNYHHNDSVNEIYRRIIEMQDILLKALSSHDENIQNKVAELALTGDSDEGRLPKSV